MCFDTIETNINMTVPWFLMAAYAYYIEDDPILSDAQFDRLVKRMIEHWDKIEHRHKELITLENLEAGTFLGAYPEMVKGAVKQIRGLQSK
jgi:NAD-dependent DNA ligase